MSYRDNKIRLQHKLSYGRILIYPRNEKGRLVAGLLGKKTLDAVDILKLEELGYEIEWIPRDIRVDENGDPVGPEDEGA